MAQVFITLVVAVLALSSFAQGFVLPHYAQLMGNDYEYVEETPSAPTPTPSYIMRIAQSNELGEPVVAEVTKFIDNKSTADAASADQRRQGKTLTYTELDKLLANWQMAKERNAYEMQGDRRYGGYARHY
nr:uncharacterized protein LOC106617193 isoform X1 [Bactrocera oleae]XP_036228498.1 uncharacterized protein LOC106617193 isoform X1 [Bactrocera oleae]